LTVCVVCNRAPRGFGYDPRLARENGKPGWACSMRCLDIIKRTRGMVDATPNEQAAMQEGGAMGGEYLESIGKTDLATLTGDEWTTFVECVITGYHDKLVALCAADADRMNARQQVPA